MFQWILNEAKNRNVSPEGYEGGLLIDEMTIQQDIQFSKKGGTLKLIGFEDFAEESKHMNILMNHKKNVCLATHVLQFLFLGTTGFVFHLHISRQLVLLHQSYIYCSILESCKLFGYVWFKCYIFKYGWGTIKQRFYEHSFST
jgi:hypothetical protein